MQNTFSWQKEGVERDEKMLEDFVWGDWMPCSFWTGVCDSRILPGRYGAGILDCGRRNKMGRRLGWLKSGRRCGSGRMAKGMARDQRISL